MVAATGSVKFPTVFQDGAVVREGALEDLLADPARRQRCRCAGMGDQRAESRRTPLFSSARVQFSPTSYVATPARARQAAKPAGLHKNALHRQAGSIVPTTAPAS
jgi:hypothetical protein